MRGQADGLHPDLPGLSAGGDGTEGDGTEGETTDELNGELSTDDPGATTAAE